MIEENPEYLLVLSNIAGVILGAGITALINWLLISKETKLRVREKVFDRRISAYEEVLSFARYLCSTLSTKEAAESGEMITYPVFLHSRKNFDHLLNELHKTLNPNSHWLDSEIVQEIKYIQDYLGNLDIQLDLNDENINPEIGAIVRNDFFEMSNALEEKALKFFRKDINKLSLQPKQGDKKFDNNVFQNRIKKTNLYKQIINS